jgi:dolichyl-phosphooligosaccharide-protein glycotransferase
MVHETRTNKTSEVKYKHAYNSLFKGNITEIDTGYVKIFEYVKDAKITGTISLNETVKISTLILTS